MANHLYSLMEAYQAVYAPQELTEDQIWEEVESWVNSLMEEGYDLSEYSWEDMYEEYLNEVLMTGKNRPTKLSDPLSGAVNAVGNAARSAGDAVKNTLYPKMQSAPGHGYAGGHFGPVPTKTSPTAPTKPPSGSPTPPTKPPGGSPTPAVTRAAASSARPSGGSAASSARPSGGPPAAPSKVAPAKPAGSAMDQWAKANPKLATAAAEKSRIRGTQQTDNPLMKGMRSRLPMNSPSVQSPAVSKLGKGNQSLTQNSNAFKAAAPKPVTPTAAISAAPKTSPTASGSVVPATNAIAAKPSSAMSQDSIRRGRLNMGMEYDAYDLVLEYLLSEGHAETVEEAQYIMIEMDAETISDIAEAESSYDRNRKRVAQRAAARNEARAKGQTGNVPGVGYVTSRKEKETYTDSSGKTRHGKGL